MERGRRRGIIIGGMVLGLLLGCNNGGAELEKKNSFFDSFIKIRQGFQEIFGIFGNTIGDALGFNAVKSTNKRSEIGKHFEKRGERLKSTKNKLNELLSDISSSKNADVSTIKFVEEAIKGANGVFEQIIGTLTKLAGVAKEAGATDLGAALSSNAAVGADEKDVNAVIESVKEIIEVAKRSGIEIKPGDSGGQVKNGDGPKVLAGNVVASAGDAAKLASELAKADPWAMIDKIKNTKAKIGNVACDNTNEAGALAAGTGDASVAAKSNADLAAAVA